MRVFCVAKWGAALAMIAGSGSVMSQGDPYLWLEDVAGEKAITWVNSRNAESRASLEAKPEFKSLHQRLLAIYGSKDRIPGVQARGAWLYNFWQDERNPRGLWRRTSLREYRKADPEWETVIDMDRLGADERENWVWKGAHCLYPEFARCLVSLSRGGADAVEIREFDTVKKAFVKDGFLLPVSKGIAVWRDADTLYIARDFGPGTLTTSGYPRMVKEWRRGTPMAEAKTIFEGRETDVAVDAVVTNERGHRYERLQRHIEFWNAEEYLRRGERWVRIVTPPDAKLAMVRGQLLVHLKTDWKAAETIYPAGALIAIGLDRFLDGARDFEILFAPRERVALRSFDATRSHLVLNVIDQVKGRTIEVRRESGRWESREVDVPAASTISTAAVDIDASDAYWMTVTNFLSPTTLYLATANGAREKLKVLPAFYDSRGLATLQHEATSKDGTKIPYFVVMREGARLDGTNPTVLYGYGGFEIPMTPGYNATMGASWLEKGGIWVLANIRGGGEFGPAWHKTARREGRRKTHDDFIAVAEDIIRRGITSPKHLGIMGGSQGGLLVGAAFTQRPELFRAVVCQVPLLDMRRYHKLLAGASWMGEYGDPDNPQDWAFISTYSPYQNVVKDRRYPRILFVTSTRDDRVHPGHARKMVAKMRDQGHEVVYYENTEGGHAAASTPAQQAYMWALTYSFLLDALR